MVKIRCEICQKKIAEIFIEIYTCKCEKIFCRKHKLDHNCDYNHKKNNINFLNKKLIKITTKKLNF